MADIIDELLARYANRLDTRAIQVRRDAIGQCYPVLSEHLPEGAWLVATDENTWEVAGKAFVEVLESAGRPWVHFQVPNGEDGEAPICDDALVSAYQEQLLETGCSAGIAVGSGTINDTVKLASFNLGRPMAVIGTAPSMNGYTSAIAAVLSDGVKTTNPCEAPRVVIADLDVMAEAPYRMICSGLGDLMSKPVSNADWQLSAELNATQHSAEAMEIIEAGAAMLDGVAPRLPDRERDAVGGLVRSLMLSGIAMSVAGSSSPASGGEHLISHYIDMTAHAFDLPFDFHGCQVGVGTLTTAFFYEKLRAMDPHDIDIDACVARLEPWPEYREMLRERFGPLFEAVVKHAEPGYPDPAKLRRRLEALVAGWDTILTKVGRTLRTRQSLEDELRAANCPVRFASLDVDYDRARCAITYSKDIRNRYTILHLAWELGVIDAWADEAMSVLFE